MKRNYNRNLCLNVFSNIAISEFIKAWYKVTIYKCSLYEADKNLYFKILKLTPQNQKIDVNKLFKEFCCAMEESGRPLKSMYITNTLN